MQIYSTNDIHVNGVKMLIHSASGAGKTTLIKTLPNPIILSAESGLLSIAGTGIPYIPIKSIGDINLAYDWLTRGDGRQYQSIAIDSLSEIAEVILINEKKVNRDARQAYTAMAEQTGDMIRRFRDIPGKHIYFTCKTEKSTDEMGRVLYAPSCPGKTFAGTLSYFFDLVLALRVEKNPDGQTIRAIMTDSDGLWGAKDRSGKLDQWEPCDLGYIINKIQGVPNA